MYKKVFILISVCFLLAIESFANNTNSNLTIEPYTFENSKKEKVQAEFGRLKVPMNRYNKGNKTIEIAFVRFKSTSKNPGSPIIYLAGGPGGSGIQSAKYRRFDLFMAMREFGDVIALDQRGTGQSKPNLRCPGRLSLSFDQPMTRKSLISEEATNLSKCEKSWNEKGIDTASFNTVESANDINDLRIALGAKKVSLWGISYGTHLALATIRQHGKYIDKAILAGVEGTNETLKLPSSTQKLLIDIDKRVKVNEELRKKMPDFLGSLEKILKNLEEKPVTVEIENRRTKKKTKVTIGKFDVQIILGSYSGRDSFLASLPNLVNLMQNGDYSFIAQQMLWLRRGRTSSLMSVAMDCASGISEKRNAQITDEAEKSLLGNAINAPFPEVCKSINYAKLGSDFRKPVKSKLPVLLISGTLDGRTPVSNAEFAQKGFKNSSHLIINGAGHSDPLFLSSPKIKETMMKFMSGNKLPKTIRIETAKPFKFIPIS